MIIGEGEARIQGRIPTHQTHSFFAFALSSAVTATMSHTATDPSESHPLEIQDWSGGNSPESWHGYYTRDFKKHCSVSTRMALGFQI